MHDQPIKGNEGCGAEARSGAGALSKDVDFDLRRRLKVAIAFTGVIFFVELIGGLLTNSLALLSDAAHVFMDVLALSLSLFALYISGLPPTAKRTFGLHRAEVLVAFINGVSIAFISLFIFYKASARLLAPEEVESLGMLVVAVVGLIVNTVVALWLIRYASTDLNIKSAFLHVVGDAAASVGVIIGALVIYSTGWYAADPIISIVIGIIILFGAGRIIRDSSHILLEGTPKEVDLKGVLEDIKGVDGVGGVHSLHIWSICHNVHALSAHVDSAPGVVLPRATQGCIVKEINEKLAENHHIFYTTIQMECSLCETGEVLRTLEHRDKGHVH